MFQQRQLNEVIQLVEISFVNLTPGAVGNNTTVGTTGACTLSSPGSGFPATFALGDTIAAVIPSAAAAINGVIVNAQVTATPGTAQFNFQNATGGSITPAAGAKYTVVAIRTTPALVP